jgi:hypothetical protein
MMTELPSPASAWMLNRAYDWAHGSITGSLNDNVTDALMGVCEPTWFKGYKVNTDTDRLEYFYISKGFPIEFSYQDGKVFQGDKFPEDKIFSNRLDSLSSLGQIIGLDESAAKDIQSFVAALETNIETESSRLTGLLKAALSQAKLGDVTKKITFSQDADGRIVIEGNIRKDQKERLAQIINDDSELSELIKTQSAKKAVLAELKESITDEPADYKSYNAWLKHNARPMGFDLSKDSLAPSREQLLKRFLNESGVSLSELGADPDAVLGKYAELGEIKGLRNEINALLTAEIKKAEAITTETAPQPLLAMKRGELVELVGMDDIDDRLSSLKQKFTQWIRQYNVSNGEQSGLNITGYTVTLDEQGRASINAETDDGDFKSKQLAAQFLMSQIAPKAFEDIGLAILDAHDDEHGDVQEYLHSVIIESGDNGYRIESPDADQAALAELETPGNYVI